MNCQLKACRCEFEALHLINGFLEFVGDIQIQIFEKDNLVVDPCGYSPLRTANAGRNPVRDVLDGKVLRKRHPGLLHLEK